jgi:uncharacterized membrane protein
MAGIGFALDRLYHSNSIADRMASFAHASVIAAGPCLLSVLCIWLIGSFNSELEGRTTISAFRAIVIYSFALSFVITAPVGLVSARLVSDKLHDRDVAAIPGIMLACLSVGAVAVMVASAILFGGRLTLDTPVAAAAMVDCALIALIWIGCLFCSVTRDYNSVTGFFAAGMLVALVAVTGSYALAPDLGVMLWAFSFGLGVTLFGLLSRIIITFPFAVRDIATPLRALLRGALGYWPIALGGLFGALGTWIDKWIIWLSPYGVEIQQGLVHAPLCDSAMFLSYLVVVPAYAAFVVHLEVKFFRNYRLFYSSILEHATLAQIRSYGRRLRDETIASLSGIMVPQLVICALVAFAAPAVIGALDMQFRQVGTLRLGVVGAVFQFLFVTCASLVLYFDRRVMFFALQACFLVLNVVLTIGTLWFGQPYLGLGFLFAATISAAIAYLALVRTLYRLDYLTFIANNPAFRIRGPAVSGC